MKKHNVEVTYLVRVTETQKWAHDEMNDLNYDNIECNLNPDDAPRKEIEEILRVKLDGENFIV